MQKYICNIFRNVVPWKFLKRYFFFFLNLCIYVILLRHYILAIFFVLLWLIIITIILNLFDGTRWQWYKIIFVFFLHTIDSCEGGRGRGEAMGYSVAKTRHEVPLRLVMKSISEIELIGNIGFRQKKEYMKCHIPEAIHMDFHIATYPNEYSSYALYPPKIFQRYARILGINIDDHLIFYGRGALGGMLVPSTIAWLFKVSCIFFVY